MKNIDMMHICHKCCHYRHIRYSNGTSGIGCLAYNVESQWPVDIRYIKHCPEGKDEKK